MKYKLLKDINGAKAWIEFDYDNIVQLYELNLENNSIYNLTKLFWIDNTDYFEKVVEYDFSEFVGRNSTILAVKGKKLLKIHDGWDIEYNNDARGYYTDPLHYEETTLDKLEKWDMFVYKFDSGEKLHHYNIYMWYWTQHLTQHLIVLDWIEIISFWWNKENQEVIKILRT